MVEIDSDNIHFLMTHERIQALDLIVHLISTSTKSIILCGPEGIGKTKFLKVLQEHIMTFCHYYPIEGNKELNLKKVQEELDKAWKHIKSDKFDHASARMDREQKYPKKKPVLIIDNAGFLVPGLMTQILQYANDNPYLKAIFVLTHDQLQLKYKSDQAIEDCNIVEIQPLSEKQCGDFLQHLTMKSSSPFPVSAINESMIAAIYRDTQGVPAKIIAEFSAMTPAKIHYHENSTQILVVAVTGLVLIALCVQWYSSRQTVTEIIAPEKADRTIDDTQFNQPYLTLPALPPAGQLPDNYLQLNLDEKLQQGDENISGAPLPDADRTIGHFPSTVTKQNLFDSPTDSALEKSGLTEVLPQPIEEKALSEQNTVHPDGSAWLSSQPDNNYTLQLMVLSKEQSILNVIKKYPALQQEFRYVKRLIKGREKFVLLYGSFNDSSSAETIKQHLPSEFRKSFPRKIIALKKEIGLPPTVD